MLEAITALILALFPSAPAEDSPGVWESPDAPTVVVNGPWDEAGDAVQWSVVITVPNS